MIDLDLSRMRWVEFNLNRRMWLYQLIEQVRAGGILSMRILPEVLERLEQRVVAP